MMSMQQWPSQQWRHCAKDSTLAFYCTMFYWCSLQIFCSNKLIAYRQVVARMPKVHGLELRVRSKIPYDSTGRAGFRLRNQDDAKPTRPTACLATRITSARASWLTSTTTKEEKFKDEEVEQIYDDFDSRIVAGDPPSLEGCPQFLKELPG